MASNRDGLSLDANATFRVERDLSHLSVARHLYYDGYTRIHGSLVVTGPSTERLPSLDIDVLENGQVSNGNIAALRR